ncbi:MAG: DNA helicase RecQ [Dehalococcoidia bacterium]|nr:DNA helicase RecQ [Dehalococcoidia bacterium]
MTTTSERSATEAAPSLLPTLQRYFGFTSFRPLQEEIIRDTLAGRDVLAILPTGAGKSLCYQLPALVRPGLTLVVSPLIALMKDQVDALQAIDVPATFLNSSLAPEESRARLRGLHNGQYRLLYVAPERLMLPGFLSDLHTWRPNLLAIDEAHCISEWGHDFRPEYRQLADVRALFPAVPVMALTATATSRVREDIAGLLRLRDPRSYLASFNRLNLTYRVLAKSRPFSQVMDFLQARPRDSGIVYCLSRNTTESLAERLNANGVTARPYHAGLPPETRSRHQEMFLRDEIRIICATIAFGMGVNKPNVRFVLHYDLPKSVEAYYQETGRAGRDGLPGECLLLFNPGDAVKHGQFIDEKPDPQQAQAAREQLQRIVQYAESAACRRSELLRYFGEEFLQQDCGACDNCLSPRGTFDGTVAAQKLMSCVHRIHDKSGFSVGLGHVTEVLTGADTERIRRWGHNQLSTYGVGKEHSRQEWTAIGHELVRLGYLRQTAEKFSVLELTPEGRAVLFQRTPVTLAKPAVAPEAPSAAASAYDDALFERLRQLRKRLADERDVPAYIVFSDVALRQMAREYPSSEREFSRVSGVGERKLREFSAVFLAEIASYLRDNPRRAFAVEPPQPPPGARDLGDSPRETLRRFRAGQSVNQISQERGFVTSTIYGHLTEAVIAGETVELGQLLTEEQQALIATAFQQTGWGNITGAKELLGDGFDYGQLRVFRAAHGQDYRQSRA